MLWTKQQIERYLALADKRRLAASDDSNEQAYARGLCDALATVLNLECDDAEVIDAALAAKEAN
jgi:hypothetical protein